MIDALLDGLLEREGGYVNHPADRGGPTNYGITETVARAYGYEGDMRALPRELALSIYRKRYWERPGFEAVARRYPRLAAELFDTGVNMGPKVAAQFLQRTLRLLAGLASADGDIGPLTLLALDAFKAKRGPNGEDVLLKAVDALQGARYISIAESNPSQRAFVYGWLDHRVGT